MSEANDIPPHNKTDQETSNTPKFSDFQVQELIGKGAFAHVYRATDPVNRVVALKVLKEQYTFDKKLREGFIQEAQTAAKLQHQNIVLIYQMNKPDDKRPYISMEYAGEGDLRQYSGQGRSLSFTKLRSIITQTSNALQYAHTRGFVHRDVKPSNILISNQDTIKLADFGIARAFHQTNTQKFSTMVAGTAVYMAPEQASSTAKLTAQADIYALGVVIYELFTGELPFTERDFADLIQQKRKGTPKPLPEEIPKRLQNIIFKALKADLNLRYSSVLQFQQQLISALNDWERHTQERQGHVDHAAKAFAAMEQEKWYDARDLWQQALKLSDSRITRMNLDAVNTEITRLEAWQKTDQSFETESWQEAIDALETIIETKPDNIDSVTKKLKEANHQLDLQILYTEGMDAYKDENYIKAIRTLENVVAQAPEYRDGEAKKILDVVHETQAQSLIQETKLNILFALAQQEWDESKVLVEELRKLAPEGEHGVDEFIIKIKSLSGTAYSRTDSVNKKLLNARLKADENEKRANQLQEELNDVQQKLGKSHLQHQKLQGELSTLEGRLGTELFKYADLLTTITIYFKDFENNFVVKRIMPQYSEKIANLAQIAREIITWGKDLHTPYIEANEEEKQNE